ncbi:unnamed protein product [Brachionus calyciflorus]|uniref:Uncharacterized protein n=1 Tax=Brachionus calyciflorus TaxID=104777 RepID=A0A813MFT7_9BILA|nr:unnamed protein product [Brachionus calyciflorus]
MSNLNLNSNLTQNENKRIFEYFLVAGLPPKLTAKSTNTDTFQPLNRDQHEKLIFQNADHQSNDKKDPIVDIAIMNKTLNEGIPNGYDCLKYTSNGNLANLCSESMFNKTEMYLLIRRGLDKPPIADIGIFYEDRETIKEGCTVLRKTIGDNSANLNISNLNTDRVYITYRRLSDLACNSLAMIDLCVIITSKGEHVPHSFNKINKNLNIGLFGSSIFLCYKKTWIQAPQIKYTPSILFKYPQNDHVDLPIRNDVASFGLPMGATIESWPKSSESNRNNVYLCNLKPIFSTFVLNINSDDGSVIEKVYGSTITFYEDFDENFLNEDQCSMLNYTKNDPNQSKSLHSNKSLIILSRDPLFDTFKSFLLFLFNKYTKKPFLKNNSELIIPIERYLSYLIYDVPFPTLQKPHVLVHLTDKESDCLSVNLPTEIALPQSGASFVELLFNLDVENSINVFVFAILQRSIMVHSLRRQVLTSVVEAISSIIFPFIWKLSYLPMCPLNFYQLIDAPVSFIFGMDTRFFDYFDTPQNVICIDLDTNTIKIPNERNTISSKILPRRVVNYLRDKLTNILTDLHQLYRERNSMQTNSNREEVEIKKRLRNLELSIRETFLKAMAHILSNYKQFLRTVTRRPDVRAIDRNISKFFDIEGFLKSHSSSQQFYNELIRTQLFYDCIMNLSFTSELELSLAESYALFADLCSKINQNPYDEIKLMMLNNSINSQTVVLFPPVLDAEFLNQLCPDLTNIEPHDMISNGSAFIYDENLNSFPKLKSEIYLNLNSNVSSSVDLDISIGSRINTENQLIENFRKNSISRAETQSNSSGLSQNINKKLNRVQNTPIGIRTKSEKLHASKKMEQKLNFKPANSIKQAQKNYYLKSKYHAHCYLSNAYALWFIYLPELIKEFDDMKKMLMDYAFTVLARMQEHKVIQPDEICYRIMMQLCLVYNFPTIAVRVYFHMKKYNIDISPITYSYYNKALIETTNWPSFDQDKWAKIRLMWQVISKFKENLKLRRERENRTKRTSKNLKKKRNSTLKSKKIINENFNVEPLIRHQLDFRNLDSKPKSKHLVFVSPNLAKFQNIDRKFDYNEHNFLLKSTGLVFISYQLIKNENKREPRHLIKTSSLPENLNCTNITNKKDSNDIKSIHNDPLGAFLNQEKKFVEKIEVEKNSKEDTKKRLFDYKPFEHKEIEKSDFIFGKNESNNINTSYDSDVYSDDYTDSDEDDYYDESVAYEDDSDVEVDMPFSSRSEGEGHRKDFDSHSQSKNSTKGFTIDIENIVISSNNTNKTTPETNGSKKGSGFFSNFSSPFLSPFNPKTNNLLKRLEDSLETSASKLKEASQFITDKSLEMKDTFIPKSITSYSLKTQQVFNNVVKSTSSFTFRQGSNQKNLNGTPNKSKIDNDINSKHVQDLFNLEPFPTDDTYKPLDFNFWAIDNRVNCSLENKARNCLIEVQMSTCNYCDNCKAFLYDEEIMSGWTLNDSDLNIKCQRCSASMVPNLYIKIKDLENMKIFLHDQNKTIPETESESHPFTEGMNDSQENIPINSTICTMEFNVNYLSPLVVRKELENIILNESQENDYICLIDEKFMTDHKIIFWNLMWYFKRIGLDCTHLETVLLNSRIKFTANEAQISVDNSNFFDYKALNINLSKPQYHNHPYVRISCMWDNLVLHNQTKTHEVPLYLSWLINNFKIVDQQSKHRLLRVLTQEDLKYLRSSSIKPISLTKLIDIITRNIKESEIAIPINNLLRERMITKVNFTSLYREILYLVIVALEREYIDIDAFDTEYKETYKNLISKEQIKEWIRNSDQPPNYIAVWCRRLFSICLKIANSLNIIENGCSAYDCKRNCLNPNIFVQTPGDNGFKFEIEGIKDNKYVPDRVYKG